MQNDERWPGVPVPFPRSAGGRLRAAAAGGRAEWGPATIEPDVVAGVAGLKQRYEREVQVHGSAGLAQTLLSHRLVDALHVLTSPVVLGAGKRLFERVASTAFELQAARTTGRGVVVNTYRRAGEPTFGSFRLDD
ncbi:dihydrofolate reductase family protein [Sorangium sp. So ce887]|uniref:dihydrofolate reductase family protein n=1 Tax=Sorangium sp. So ce887 TaxID=3133324 RepID=UPI003F623EE3